MLGDEIEMVDEAHRLLEARMQLGTGELGRLAARDATYELEALVAEILENILELASVVVRFVSLAVGKVGSAEGVGSGEKIFHARQP